MLPSPLFAFVKEICHTRLFATEVLFVQAGKQINISDMHILLSSCVGSWQSLCPLTAHGSDEHEARYCLLNERFVSLMPSLYRAELSNFLLLLYYCSGFDSYVRSADFGETLNVTDLIFICFKAH